MYIIAEVTWWLLLAFGCTVAVSGVVVFVQRILNQDMHSPSKAREEPTDLVEMAKEFGTLVGDKYNEAKHRYSYDEDGLKLIINKIANRVPDKT